MKNLSNMFNVINKCRKSPKYKEIICYVRIIIFSILIAFIFDNYIVVNAQIPSESMCNGINKGDRLIAFRLAYINSQPERGDIIIFKFPDDEKQDYIKRIIGLPGDTVEIKSGVLYINGQVYREDYLKEPMEGNFGPYDVPSGHYFMLGDNRNISIDSRFWQNKYVSKDQILGKAIFKYYPKIVLIK